MRVSQQMEFVPELTINQVREKEVDIMSRIYEDWEDRYLQVMIDSGRLTPDATLVGAEDLGRIWGEIAQQQEDFDSEQAQYADWYNTILTDIGSGFSTPPSAEEMNEIYRQIFMGDEIGKTNIIPFVPRQVYTAERKLA